MPSPSACPDLPPVVAAMCQPSFHQPAAVDVTVLQTHISYLIFAGTLAYKIKKPVQFAFLDFSTLERRIHFCREEVRLNQALAPGVYLEVRGLRAARDGYEFCRLDDDAVIEAAVVMRRLPADRMLAHLLDVGEIGTAQVDSIVAALVPFYREADAGPSVTAAGDPAVVAQQMRDDFAEMNRFHGDTIASADDIEIQNFCLDTLHHCAPLLRRRQQEGRVRDGHGDLHADNICLTDERVIIFDRIEFNPRFRQRDVAADIAFMAMDLEFRGRTDLARYLVKQFSTAMSDGELPSLIPLFASHRAYIRGKVDSLKSAAAEVDEAEREKARQSAAAHFALAYRLTWSNQPSLVVVMGLSGSGKSTLAAALQRRIGGLHVNSDVVRKRLAGLSPTSRAGVGDDDGLYGPRQSELTYRTMLTMAGDELSAGRIAIVDATFLRRPYRDEARRTAAEHRVPILFLECRAPHAAVERRLAQRAARDDDPSDADIAIYRRQQEEYEPIDADGSDDWMGIDGDRPTADNVAAIVTSLRHRLAVGIAPADVSES